MYLCNDVCRFQNFVLRCPTPRLHCFLSSNWPSFTFLSFMAFLIPSIQFFFGLPRALFCFGIHFNAILCNLPSAILWTWSYRVSWFCSISYSKPNTSNAVCDTAHPMTHTGYQRITHSALMWQPDEERQAAKTYRYVGESYWNGSSDNKMGSHDIRVYPCMWLRIQTARR